MRQAALNSPSNQFGCYLTTCCCRNQHVSDIKCSSESNFSMFARVKSISWCTDTRSNQASHVHQSQIFEDADSRHKSDSDCSPKSNQFTEILIQNTHWSRRSFRVKFHYLKPWRPEVLKRKQQTKGEIVRTQIVVCALLFKALRTFRY